MEENYPNLNTQYIYNKFEEKYKKEYYKSDKSFLGMSILEWIKGYVKSDLFMLYIVILLSLIFVSFLEGYNLLYKYIYILWIPTFIICSLISYFTNFSNKEKIIANSVIEKILEEEKINKTSTSIKKLIDSRDEIGNDFIRLFKVIKNDSIYTLTKSIILGILGIFVGFISSEISKEGMELSDENYIQLVFISIQIVLYFICFYILFYYIYISIYRIRNLYIQVLKDIELTIELKN